MDAYYEQNIPITLNIEYYTGWEPSVKNCILTQKVVEGFVVGKIQDGYIVDFTYPHMFSWGNGPTLPTQTFTLLDNYQLGYYYNGPRSWKHHIPRWELVK
jgi:hypothetical protein